MGEPTLELTASAISNALKNATGIRSYQIPLTLEQVFWVKTLKSRSEPVRPLYRLRALIKSSTTGMGPRPSKNPANLAETLEMLSTKDWQTLAGGTDVVVQGSFTTRAAS